MTLSYETTFKLWSVLFLAAGAAPFFLFSPVTGGILAAALLVPCLWFSLKRPWWLPRVSAELPVFLMLHSVSETVVDPVCPNNTLHPAELERLIADLLRSGYTFQTAIDAIRNPEKRSVVLTFDDGLIDNYTVLFPILKKFNVPATLFITNRGDADPDNFLTRDHIREMSASGLIEFGGHTANHAVLNSVPPEAAHREIQENFTWLSEQLDISPACFAYPCGGYTAETIEILKTVGYSYAFTMHKKMRPVDADPYQIHRQILPRGKTPLEAYLIATRGKSRI